jgi:hypothetical protein
MQLSRTRAFFPTQAGAQKTKDGETIAAFKPCLFFCLDPSSAAVFEESPGQAASSFRTIGVLSITVTGGVLICRTHVAYAIVIQASERAE